MDTETARTLVVQAAAKSGSACAGGAARSSALAIRSRRERISSRRWSDISVTGGPAGLHIEAAKALGADAGRRTDDLIAGRPAWVWIDIFRMCFEWRYDGGTRRAGRRKVRTGQYVRREWPGPGGGLAQDSRSVEALYIIKDEETKIANG